MQIRHLIIVVLVVLTGSISCSKEDILSRDYKTLGNAANDLLSSSKYQALELEISYAQYFKPSDAVINHLTNYLQTRLNKPGGITVFMNQINNTNQQNLSIDEVVDLEKKVRTKMTRPGVIAVHILITDANFTEVSVLGNAYWNTSMSVYGMAIERFSGGSGQVSRDHLYSTLIEHEFGHLLGLVDQGTPMTSQHKDAGNGAHCINTYCLMNHLIETDANKAPTIPELDSGCILDLRNNGGK